MVTFAKLPKVKTKKKGNRQQEVNKKIIIITSPTIRNRVNTNLNCT